jgi:hypothetical protein
MVRCFKRFDASFTGPPQKSAALVTSLYGVDTNWYVDSGATDHITRELEKLSIRDKVHRWQASPLCKRIRYGDHSCWS